MVIRKETRKNINKEKKRGKRLFFLIFTILILVVLFIGVHQGTNYLQDRLIRNLESALDRPVSLNKARIQFFPHFGVTFHGLAIENKGGKGKFFSLDRLFLKIKMGPLLKGKLKFSEAVFSHPFLKVNRNCQGRTCNFFPFLAPGYFPGNEGEATLSNSPSLFSLLPDTIVAEEGMVEFIDRHTATSSITTAFTHINLSAQKNYLSSLISFRFASKIDEGKGDFNCWGQTKNIPPNLDFSRAESTINFTCKTLSLSQFIPYCRKYLNDSRDSEGGKDSFSRREETRFPSLRILEGSLIVGKEKIKILRLTGGCEGIEIKKAEGAISLVDSSYPSELSINADLELEKLGWVLSPAIFSPRSISRLKEFQILSGKAGIELRLSGSAQFPLEFREGDLRVTMEDAKIAYKTLHLPLLKLSGAIHFSPDVIETSGLDISWEKFSLSVAGKAENYLSPTPLIYLTARSDLLGASGFRFPPIERFHASITIDGGRVALDSVQALIEGSSVELKGSIEDFLQPKISFILWTPAFDLRKVIPKAKIKGFIKQRVYFVRDIAKICLFLNNLEEGSLLKQISWHGTVEIKETITRKRKLNNLIIDVFLDGGGIEVKKVEYETGGGEFKENGWMHVLADNGLDFNLTSKVMFDIKDSSQKEYGRDDIDIKMLADGKVNNLLVLEGRAENSQEIKQYFQGKMGLKISQGRIEKFGILSKIFSLLNVSQLLKLKFPDILSKGMPFEDISGNFTIHDGIFNTKDFFIDSEAMKISLVGDIDTFDNQVDLKIGVQPFGTVDFILSNVPIVGHVLTGKKKSLVIFYFEAKGEMPDPKVTPIPFRSLGEGVIGIFKRIFQIPQNIIFPNKQH